jgi:urea carboxylase-associated protein 2
MPTSSTPTAIDKAARIAALRARYLELKAGAEAPARSPTPLDARPPLPPTAAQLVHREVVAGGWYRSLRIARGQVLRILNPDATPGVALTLWNADDTSERYNAGDTVKIQWTARLTRNRLLFSDMGRVLAAITADSCGLHDTLVGGSTRASNLAKYGEPCGDAGLRNTRDNFVLAAGKLGLGRRDLGTCISFFSPVATDAVGRLSWREGGVRPGDYVDLRAEMNLLAAISNCPHPLAPGATFAPAAIELLVLRGTPAPADDVCRTATVEGRRGYENTDAYFASTGGVS